MEIIYATERWDKGPPSLLLGGPCPRTNSREDWKPGALEIIEQLEFEGTVIIPVPKTGHWIELSDSLIDWRIECFENATAVAFWVPRDLKNLLGLRTNVDFGSRWTVGRFVLGYPHDAVKMRYLHRRAEMVGAPIRHSLRETLEAGVHIANSWPMRPHFD